MTDLEKIGFGGGCHWCTEAVFQSLRGVHAVEQGFIRSHPPADSWSEAVIVSFDPGKIDTGTLISVHVRTHASTKTHSMRSKYRSAVYAFNDRQSETARDTLKELQADFEGKLITSVLDYEGFKSSDERFHNYYQSNPEKPFCKRYIDPKLDVLRSEFRAEIALSEAGMPDNR